jgi:hypothetical protein
MKAAQMFNPCDAICFLYNAGYECLCAYKGRILTIFVRQYRLLYGRTFLQKNLKTTVAYERANEAYPVLI